MTCLVVEAKQFFTNLKHSFFLGNYNAFFCTTLIRLSDLKKKVLQKDSKGMY